MEKENRINILPSHIVNKIAAGEVVERPASVVKELLENSLDAGADEIRIQIINAGKKQIRVRDNGRGIYPDDLEKAFLRHATSKISALDDLFAINSLGFRGEALFSIAAVSRVLLRSKVRGGDAWEIEVVSGRVNAKRPTSMADGTEVIVSNLFFNTPARLKFLKSDRTEERQIINTVLPYTIIYPEKQITLASGKREIIRQMDNDLLKRIEALFGIGPENVMTGEARLTHYRAEIRFVLSDINVRRPKRDVQFIFVNNRPVVVPALQAVINKAYRVILPEGSFPAFFIWIDLPPEDVDVNIHPTKREVRFKDEGIIYSIGRFIERSLSGTSPVAIDLSAAKTAPHSLGQRNTVAYVKGNDREKFAEKLPLKGNAPSFGFVKKASERRAVYGLSLKRVGEPFKGRQGSGDDGIKQILQGLRPIGVFINKYGLAEAGESLYVIDMHAAQEKVAYERLLKQIETRDIDVQNLLTPIPIRLSIEEIEAFEELKDVFPEMGFDISEWKDNTIAVNAYPVIIKDIETAVRQILSEKISISDMNQVKEMVARKACRGSIMAGDSLSLENLIQLLEDMKSLNAPLTCPHGRPTIAVIKDNDLERFFLRG